jgi:hypothetical protein
VTVSAFKVFNLKRHFHEYLVAVLCFATLTLIPNTGKLLSNCKAAPSVALIWRVLAMNLDRFPFSLILKILTHLHLVPTSRMRGAIPPLLQYTFMAWCSVKKAQGQLYLLLRCWPSKHRVISHSALQGKSSSTAVITQLVPLKCIYSV